MYPRYIPKDATEIQHPQGRGVVYAYTSRDNRQAAVAYTGKAGKSSWHYSFIGKDTEAQREKRIREFFEGLDAHAKQLAEYRSERTKPHTFKVGDVVINTWGWEQTNQDFYEVVKATANTVWLRSLKQETTETGFMAGYTTPRLGEYASDEVEQHRADGRNYISFKHGCGGKWDGKPERCSWYA